jgi:hypothetical protein
MANTNLPLGILTLAFDARLNNAAAFAGLSIFEGEELATGKQGRLAARVGRVTLAFAGETEATLHRIGELGAHVDLGRGTISVTSPENARVEVHADDALLRSETGGMTQVQIKILSATEIEVTLRRGNLDFWYCEESRKLLEGQTYRIYLDSSADVPGISGGSVHKVGHQQKVTAYIVEGGGTGLLGWSIWNLLQPESPSNPSTNK